MAEVVGKEAPVLIENVSLVINVFNIGHNGDVSSIPLGQQPLGLLQQNGLLQTCTSSPLSRSTEASCGLQNSQKRGPELKEQFPLGWIVLIDGHLIPFGIQPTLLEIPNFGDRKLWSEIRVCLPPSLFADNETDVYCPVQSCREKLPRNKSIDVHIMKHLGLTIKDTQMSGNSNSAKGTFPCPLLYYCQYEKCQYYVNTGEKSFKGYKNVKQHYQKVHAPRLFECDQCQKTFSIQKVLETHKLMCGEKYNCSTCELGYNTLESLQTHCRRKFHTYDHDKYKDKRNSVKQEMQSLKSSTSPPASSAPSAPARKVKSTRKLPTLLPKGSTPASPEVFNTIQAFCQQAGVKVDLGCQTVCTAFLQKSSPVAAMIPAEPTPSFSQKKRKSTDTQTNIVKFRATCLDQKHNATNTNVDWKKVITSDSQTQTADSCDPVELSVSKPAPIQDSSIHFDDVFATFKISEPCSETETIDTDLVNENVVIIDQNLNLINVKEETPCTTKAPEDNDTPPNVSVSTETSPCPSIKIDCGPSLYSEFISFLEATDTATQTDPEMFDILGDCFGIGELFSEELTGAEDAYYVSVSSTASQTAVERVSTTSLSAEDYEVLLNTPIDKRLTDLNAFSDYLKSVEGANNGIQLEVGSGGEGGSTSGQQQGTNDFLLDWDHIVEEVYKDFGD